MYFELPHCNSHPWCMSKYGCNFYNIKIMSTLEYLHKEKYLFALNFFFILRFIVILLSLCGFLKKGFVCWEELFKNDFFYIKHFHAQTSRLHIVILLCAYLYTQICIHIFVFTIKSSVLAFQYLQFSMLLRKI